MELRRWPALLLLGATLGGGCASADARRAGAQDASPALEPTVVGERKYRDPLIGLNRIIFKFNDVVYRYLLIPAGKGYVRVIPEPARRSVGIFFHNIRTPIYVANDLLQVQPKPLGR